MIKSLTSHPHSTDEDEHCAVLDWLATYVIVEGFWDIYSPRASALMSRMLETPTPENFQLLALRISNQLRQVIGSPVPIDNEQVFTSATIAMSLSSTFH